MKNQYGPYGEEQKDNKLVVAGEQYIEKMQKIYTLFENNSNARMAVGTRVEKLSEQIGEITLALKQVENISMQVKLLSFNASIEAARAGLAGKGFAVVAQEVGKLSKSTDNAVNEIQTSIRLMGELLKSTVNDMDNAKEAGSYFDKELASCLEEAIKLVKLIEMS